MVEKVEVNSVIINNEEVIYRKYYPMESNEKVDEICYYLELVLVRVKIPLNYSINFTGDYLISLKFTDDSFEIYINKYLYNNFRNIEIACLFLHEIGHLKVGLLSRITEIGLLILMTYYNVYLFFIFILFYKVIEELYADLYGVINFNGDKNTCISTYIKFLLLRKNPYVYIRIAFLKLYKFLY